MNGCGELLGVMLTTGNAGDRESVPTMTRKPFGKLFVNPLNETGGDLSQAPERLGMSFCALRKSIRRLEIR